jgi:hypothetical protein
VLSPRYQSQPDCNPRGEDCPHKATLHTKLPSLLFFPSFLGPLMWKIFPRSTSHQVNFLPPLFQATGSLQDRKLSGQLCLPWLQYHRHHEPFSVPASCVPFSFFSSLENHEIFGICVLSKIFLLLKPSQIPRLLCYPLKDSTGVDNLFWPCQWHRSFL